MGNTFFQRLIEARPRDKDQFIDNQGGVWTYRSDGTGVCMRRHLSNKTITFTEEHLHLCRAPEGLCKATSNADKVDTLRGIIESAQRALSKAQEALEKENTDGGADKGS